MNFSSIVFIFVFLPCVLLGYYTLFRKSRRAQNVFLCLVSLFFYAWGEPLFVSVMVLTILFNWFFAMLVDRYRESHPTKAKLYLTLAISLDVLILFIFKYLSFGIENLNVLWDNRLPVPAIALPIGISFFTFQSISYVIDIYRRNGKVQKNPLDVGLYISFFPQLIAGPIVRYETISDQLEHRKESVTLFFDGIVRFVFGLGKKVILANTVAVVADHAFNGIASLSSAMAWLGIVAYTLQIYFDFSGYSDMAIGLGKMFGFEFLENFDYPYISRSVSEFWRRWHISMGTWFRDYIYFPLGGSRVKRGRMLFNLFVVWLLTGVWHGANWTFVVWGLFYFVLIAAEKLLQIEKKSLPKLLGWLYTMLFVMLGWVLFRADSIGDAALYMQSMFFLRGGISDAQFWLQLKENIWILALAVVACLPLKTILNKRVPQHEAAFEITRCALLLVIFLLSVCYLAKGTYNPFIYFNF